MDQRNSTAHPSGSRLVLVALVATLAAIGITEVTGINHVEQALIHRDFGKYQLAFLGFLWAFTTLFLRRRRQVGRASLLSFLVFGLGAGLLSGWLALPLIALLKGESDLLRSLSSWQGIIDFIAVTTVVTFGWLVGAISGLLAFALEGRPSVHGKRP